MDREKILLKREELLKEKREEVREELQRWATSHLNLAHDEKINFMISSKIVRKLLEKRKKKQFGFKIVKSQLVADDWEEILRFPLSSKQLTIVNLLRRNNNAELKVSKINELMADYLHQDDVVYLNAMFSEYGAPYRLFDKQKIDIVYPTNWLDHQLKFYICE